MTKNSNAFMPLYVGDYLADTTMLSRDQHGAYLLLIMTYWRNRGPLPDRDEGLAIATKSTAQEWKRIRPVLEPYFVIKDGVWTHKRIDEELVKADEKYAARVNASRKANGVRHGHRNGQSNGEQPDTVTVPNHNHTPTEEGFTSLPSDRRRRQAARGQTAAPVVAQSDWADGIPQWASFKAELHPTEWVSWFGTTRPNGKPSTLIVPSAFTADKIAEKYGSRLRSLFGEDFQIEVRPQ